MLGVLQTRHAVLISDLPRGWEGSWKVAMGVVVVVVVGQCAVLGCGSIVTAGGVAFTVRGFANGPWQQRPCNGKAATGLVHKS